ncbi:MAG: hypothetical protein AAGH53_12600 [Pseudomonadota bacterium]
MRNRDLEDPDNPFWTQQDFARAIPNSEILGPQMSRAFVKDSGVKFVSEADTVTSAFSVQSAFATQDRLAA